MLARLLHDLTKGRLRLPLWSGSSVNPGDLRLDGIVPRLTGNDTLRTNMTLLTDQDLGQPGGPAVLGVDGMLSPSVIPSTGSGSGSGSGSSDLIGEIKMWAGSPLRTPNGWLVCDGSELLIDANPNLFSVIGHMWGRSSSPATKFKLPNLVGRSPAGCVGINDATSGKVHKVNVRSRGSGFTPNAVYAGISLVADGSTVISSPATVTVTIGSDGGVDRVDVVLPGVVSNLAGSANPTTDPSNCTLRIPTIAGSGVGFTYDIFLAPTSSERLGWSVRVTNRGEAYASVPAVTITGPTLKGATAVAVMDGSDVSSVIVTNPGIGDPTGATVSFAGGGPSTPATAAVVFNTRPIVPGDLGGEQVHKQLVPELARHAHVDAHGNAFRERDGGTGIFAPGTPDQFAGGDRPFAVQPPYAGVLFIIKAS